MSNSGESDFPGVQPLGLGDELVAYVGHSSLGGPPYFGIRRANTTGTPLTGQISRRAQRRIERALRRAWGEVVRESRGWR